MKKGNIRAVFIFEIMGRPAEYIVNAMNVFIDRLGTLEGIQIMNRKVHAPKLIEEGKDLFTTFAEVEMILDNLDLLFTVMFNMFPAHIEIIEPDELVISNSEFGASLSNLALRLHKYEEVTKALTGEREILLKRLKEIDPDFLKGNKIESIQEDNKETPK